MAVGTASSSSSEHIHHHPSVPDGERSTEGGPSGHRPQRDPRTLAAQRHLIRIAMRAARADGQHGGGRAAPALPAASSEVLAPEAVSGVSTDESGAGGLGGGAATPPFLTTALIPTRTPGSGSGVSDMPWLLEDEALRRLAQENTALAFPAGLSLTDRDPVRVTQKLIEDAAGAALSGSAGSRAGQAGSAHAQAAQSGQPAQSAPLTDIEAALHSRLRASAQDKDGFHKIMALAFGDNYNREVAETIRQQTLAGDFSWMPKLQITDMASLTDTSGTQTGGVAMAAYSQGRDTIFVGQDLLEADIEETLRILTEEVGHALDARVNLVDAEGDEGAIFSALVEGRPVSVEELAALKAENDHGTIVINGETVQVEYFFKKLFKGIKKAVKGVFKAVGKAVKGVFNAVKNVISTVFNTIKDWVKTILQSEIFAAILTIARFIPIPIVQVIVQVIDVVRAAYSVYQGIKHGSVGAVLGGVASLAGGAANVMGKFGASASTVNTLTTIAKHTQQASMVYSAVAKKDFASALLLAGNALNLQGDNLTWVQNVAKGWTIVEAARKGNLLDAAVATYGLADQAGLLPKGDGTLSQITGYAKQLMAAQEAIKKNDYAGAAGIVSAMLGSPATLEQVSARLGDFQSIVKAAERGDLASAFAQSQTLAGVLGAPDGVVSTLGTLATRTKEVSQIYEAVKTGKLDNAATLTANMLGLGEQGRDFLEQAVDGWQLVQAAKKGDLSAAADAARSLADRHGLVTPGNALDRALSLADAQKAIEKNDYAGAAQIISRAFGSPATLESITSRLGDFQAIVKTAEAGDVGAAFTKAAQLARELGAPEDVIAALAGLSAPAGKASAIYTAVKDGNLEHAADLAGTTLGLESETINRVKAVINGWQVIEAMQAGNVSDTAGAVQALAQRLGVSQDSAVIQKAIELASAQNALNSGDMDQTAVQISKLFGVKANADTVKAHLSEFQDVSQAAQQGQLAVAFSRAAALARTLGASAQVVQAFEQLAVKAREPGVPGSEPEPTSQQTNQQTSPTDLSSKSSTGASASGSANLISSAAATGGGTGVSSPGGVSGISEISGTTDLPLHLAAQDNDGRGWLGVDWTTADATPSGLWAGGLRLSSDGRKLLIDNPKLSVIWQNTRSAWTGKSGFSQPAIAALEAQGITVGSRVNAAPAGSLGKGSGVPASIANNTNGALAEEAIANQYRTALQNHPLSGQVEVNRQVPVNGGTRVVDVEVKIPNVDPTQAEKIQIESKVGYTTAGRSTRPADFAYQAAKDGERLAENTRLRGTGQTLRAVGKVAKPVGVVLDAIDLKGAYETDGNRIGNETKRTATGIAGAAGGAWGGAAIGAAAGSAFPVVGTVVGGVVGAIVGGLGGEQVARRVYDWFTR